MIAKLRSKMVPLLLAVTMVSTVPVLAGTAGTEGVVRKRGSVLAGAAVVDSTWHVGASAGQYATDQECLESEQNVCGMSVGSHGVDPSTHSTRRQSSYGIQGRESVRALVVQGRNGDRFALISNDLYIPQDLLNRRVGQLVAEHDRGKPNSEKVRIKPEDMTISVSHSHSSPYYSTPSWGVWAFQDVFDIRFFEHVARKMADAVITAASDLRPARIGAATSSFTALKRHSFGTTVANDGTPAGFPETDIDRDLAVVRVDDVSDPLAPQPLANWVVFGLHPEMLSGNDLLTGEYVNNMYRIVDRILGGVTLFSQNDTGTAEPARDARAHAPSERQEFSHREYAQMERAAAQLAAAVVETSRDVARSSGGQQPLISHNVVPFDDDLEVGVKDLRFAPPSFRTYPSVSSCRAEKAFDGNPGVPLAGLPDCRFVFGENGRAPLPFDPGVTYDTLRGAGVPVPDNVGAPSYTGLQETLQVHLQAIRLGNIAITICPCEQWADQSRNIKSRLNKTPGDFWFGFDYTANPSLPGWQPGKSYRDEVLGWCSQNANTTWTCKDPRNPAANLPAVSDLSFRRMKAQIYNDARGWDMSVLQGDMEENSLQAETDPADPADIWGNFTHEELTDFGYDMVITVGMSNDYWGYIATYREFQRGDHYRKALTGLGPHSADFLATRLSRMAAELNGGPKVHRSVKDEAYDWDYDHQGLRADAIGDAARTYLPIYEAGLPADGGQARIVSQPADIERFDAAKGRWVGGSNYTDTPNVAVQRCVDPMGLCLSESDWAPYADGFGEVQVKANYPQTTDLPAWRAGAFEWVWEATFEAFDSDISLPDASGSYRNQTPNGTYRFVASGCKREVLPSLAPDQACAGYETASRARSYRLVSEPFRVGPWKGITVSGLTYDVSVASFMVGPAYPLAISASNTERGPIEYPDSYSSPFRFIRAGKNVVTYAGGHQEAFCYRCSFRPWADSGAIATAVVLVERSGGWSETLSASCDVAGRCSVPVTLGPGDRLTVPARGVTDEFGEVNGQEVRL